MKRLWNVLSFMAVVHLLALVGFVGWLATSDRLSRDRLESIRGLLAPTLADVRAAEDARLAAGESDAARSAEEARRLDPPLPSDAQVVRAERRDEQAAQSERRLQDEAAQHLEALNLRSIALDEREAALTARQETWEKSIESEAARRIDGQFQKTVRIYEALAGKQAKRLLLELVAADELEQAVAYLDAMSVRTAAKTLKEMKTDEENELAARLLERVRVLGIEAEIAETAGNDDVLSSAQ